MQIFDNPGKVMSVVLMSCLLTSPITQAQESNAELLAKLVLLQQQVDDLKQQMEHIQGQAKETDARVEAVTEVVERVSAPGVAKRQTTIGGYGELHYNKLSTEDPSHDVEAIDFHRFVLFIGHEFNDKARFYSEFELEHSLAGDGAPGEVEVEQAFVEFDLNPGLFAKTGVFLVPVGILNETHEPNTFYGVERNNVESIIVPGTWWEAGAGLNGHWGGDWTWDLALTSGLQMSTTGRNAFRIRSGRQKVAKATASEGAISGRLRYLGVPGLQAAMTLQYQFDPSQVADDGLDDGILLEAHIDYRRAGFGLRALYARWDFSGEAVEAAGADSQRGWYIEPSYRLNDRFGFYTRFEQLEAAQDQDIFDQWEVGLNWWLAENVVIKFDYRDRSHDLISASDRDFKGIDLGLGYSF